MFRWIECNLVRGKDNSVDADHRLDELPTHVTHSTGYRIFHLKQRAVSEIGVQAAMSVIVQKQF